MAKKSSSSFFMLLIALAIIAVILLVLAATGHFETSDGSVRDLPTAIAHAIDRPQDTPASDSINFGDPTGNGLYGGVDLDEASCQVVVSITNASQLDALFAITLSIGDHETEEEMPIPARTHWQVAYIRQQPIVALHLQETTGWSGVDINFAPDYRRCGNQPPATIGPLGGAGDSQTIERLDQPPPSMTPVQPDVSAASA